MTVTEAMAAMTTIGADALGLATNGRLAPGADADLVAIAGDPRDDPEAITRSRQVWRAGRPVLA